MYTNQEIIEKLDEYFLKQDPALVSRMAANLCIDLKRFLDMCGMTNEEADNLIFRTKKNVTEILNLVELGDEAPLKLVRCVEKED